MQPSLQPALPSTSFNSKANHVTSTGVNGSNAANTVGNLSLYDDFLTKLASTDVETGLSSSSWPEEKEAVRFLPQNSHRGPATKTDFTGRYVHVMDTSLDYTRAFYVSGSYARQRHALSTH